MIKTKQDLKKYLEMDKFALERKYKKPKAFTDEIWRFQIYLRKYEFYKNTNTKSLLYLYYKFQYHRYSVKLGFEIPPNVFGPGLRICHRGTIVIQKNVRIGKWADVGHDVTIGMWKGQTPIIGDRCWFGPGAKIFGDVKIKDDTFIGANSVVCKSMENGALAGSPAKLINKEIPQFLIIREKEYYKKNKEMYNEQ